MIWWTSLPSRLRSERSAIADLQEQASWLTDAKWGFEADFNVSAEFTILHSDEAFPLKIVYPNFFPDTLPQVLPREDIRISGHQWGKGGELCLEIRADNWDPAYTGAMMIESAHRLIAGERPSGDEIAEVPNAHRMSQGQATRGATKRLLLPIAAKEILTGLTMGQSVELEFQEHHNNEHWLIQPTRIGSADTPLWHDDKRVVDAQQRNGLAIHLGPVPIPLTSTGEHLQNLLTAIGLDEIWTKVTTEAQFYLVLVGSEECRLLWGFTHDGSTLLMRYTTINFPAPKPRLAASYAPLSTKSVAIVGAGSIGSKIAVSLARAGVQDFVLVDEDILTPENLVRHDLDARSVGMHKVDALAIRLKEISVHTSIMKRRIKLGGQESAAATDSALLNMAKCDIIIDATADHHVFNLCAAVARNERKPMAWGEVFAGGFGGLVARIRPDIDPPPHVARGQITAWMNAQERPWPAGVAGEYGIERDDQPPLIADDADVSIIAAHLTRLVIDTLLNGADSGYPASAYAIGLTASWIFEAPFDTAPIGFMPQGQWGAPRELDAPEQLKVLAEELFPTEDEPTDAA